MMLQFEKTLPARFIGFHCPEKGISKHFQLIWHNDAYEQETTLVTIVAPHIHIGTEEFPNPHYGVHFHSIFLESRACIIAGKAAFRISAPSYTQTLLSLLTSLVMQPATDQSRVRLSAAITSLLAELLGKLAVEQNKDTSVPHKKRPDGLQSARAILYATRFMKKNMSNPQLSLQDIADSIGYNSNYFCQEFSRIFSASPIRFLNQFRVHYALQLLEQSELSISEICSLVGFTNTSRLSLMVKSVSGMTPSEFRRSKKMQSIS